MRSLRRCECPAYRGPGRLPSPLRSVSTRRCLSRMASAQGRCWATKRSPACFFWGRRFWNILSIPWWELQRDRPHQVCPPIAIVQWRQDVWCRCGGDLDIPLCQVASISRESLDLAIKRWSESCEVNRVDGELMPRRSTPRVRGHVPLGSGMGDHVSVVSQRRSLVFLSKTWPFSTRTPMAFLSTAWFDDVVYPG